ncbi:hypothetical protein TeGR_g4660, partial [Tetraparma gracilis]
FFVGDETGNQEISREQYRKEQQDHKMGFGNAGRDSDATREGSDDEDGDGRLGGANRCCNIRGTCIKFCGFCWCCRKTKFDVRVDGEVVKAMGTCIKFCGCCWCCRKTKFDVRVDGEVVKAMYAVKSRKKELESTVALLKKRLDEGDTSARTPYDAAVFRMALFRRDWHLDAGLFSKCFKKSMRSKIKEKIKEDLRLADAIELEFEELDDDMKEVRLLEYARMMKLSKVERRIYFTNRLVFETELQPVGIAKKVAGWVLIILYCVGTAFYICLFGVSKGASTTNAYVAMNHRELHASKLVMSRGDQGTDWDDYADSAETGKAGTRGPKNKKLVTMTTARAATKVKALKMYTSKGCAKFGLYFFAA